MEDRQAHEDALVTFTLNRTCIRLTIGKEPRSIGSSSRRSSCSWSDVPMWSEAGVFFEWHIYRKLCMRGGIPQYCAVRPEHSKRQYATNFTLRHPQTNGRHKMTLENLVLGLKCIGLKLFWAEVFPGRSINGAEVFLGPKCASGWSMLGTKWVWVQSGLGAKLGVSQKWDSF